MSWVHSFSLLVILFSSNVASSLVLISVRPTGKSFGRIAEQLAEKLFSNTSLPTKHRKYFDRLIWDVTRGHIPPLTPASRDTLNTGVLDEDGNPVNTPHDIFVDDGIYAEIFEKACIEQAIAASIEAIFILLLLGQEQTMTQ